MRKQTGAAMNIIVVMVMVVAVAPHVLGQPQENAAETLMKFKTALTNSDPALANWNPSKPPCTGNTGNWAGVLCYNGYVWGLQLDNMRLQGQINVDSLATLPYLRSLSFINNNFQGSMPDWRKLPTLKSLYLSGNHFSGQIPNDAFDGMDSLKRVYLSNNQFSGPIPASLTSSRMVEVGLDNNQFSGAIPTVDSQNLQVFNVSNNQLQGPVPPSLLRMDPSSFTGNKALCGGPEGPSCDPPKPPPDLEPLLHAPPNAHAPPVRPNHKKSSSASPAKIAIIVLSILLALFLLLLLLLLCRTSLDDEDDETPKQQQQQKQQQGMRSETTSPYSERSPLPAGAVAVTIGTSPITIGTSPRELGGRGEQQQQPSKLSFVRDDRQKFDLQDLMRASAEVLGSGNFGASYKAVLVDGEALVVKRFKQMNNIAKEDFHDHMRRLGRLKHPNLLPLVAYLYRKEEKLLVFDFVPNNSLGKHLHDDGKRPEGWPKPLNWSCRLKVIKGVVRGLAYLYTELPSLNAPHGHLKSSNVMLDRNYNALLMDYTLGPIVNPNKISQALVAYKCPEFAQTSRTSKKSDVWCLGILILETLTGKPVDKYLGQGSKQYGVDLARWVKGIVEEANAKGARVFDKNMEFSERSLLEMEMLLQIGIACCQEDLDKRLGLAEALRKIEQLQE
ncbi:pollen receptor-like kinase 4 [Salvia miltiorrhiza]|uniref:pollen receptor-like kinase 4 n=1 Tax=Salvia miltiorrhiza TaxID=226208 RepID=UPI0025AB969B|nr:pollen receptor-like kinase 4 [Salvia miltiorrhiza]